MKRRKFIKSAAVATAMMSPVAALAAKAATTEHRKRPEPPVGHIEMFAGEEIPEGWVICDGSSGTPDLRARFMYSKSIYAPNDEKPKLEWRYIMKIK